MSMTDDPFELPHGDEFEPDTPAAAMVRLQDRLRAIHPQAAAIITAHAALELEVDRVLRRFLARPNKLPRLSIEHQLGVLRALLDDAWLDLVLDAISAYGALRNSIAHGNSPSDIAKMIGRLGNKTHNIGTPLTRYQPGFLGHGLGRRVACRRGKPAGLLQAETLRTIRTWQRHATEPGRDTPPKLRQRPLATRPCRCPVAPVRSVKGV